MPTLPTTAAEVALVPSRDLRRIARSLGISPTFYNILGERAYKSETQLRVQLEQMLELCADTEEVTQDPGT